MATPGSDTDADDGTTPDPGGFRPVDDAELEAALEAEGAADKGEGETPPGRLESYELGGKKYTHAELEELVTKGALRLEDYSKNKNELKAEQDRLARDREEFENQRRGYTRRPDDLEDEDLVEETPEERIARLEEAQQQQAYNEHVARADGLYWKTVDELLADKAVTEQLEGLGIDRTKYRELVDQMILAHNPSTKDLQAFQAEVRKIFPGIHDTLVGLVKGGIDHRLDKLRKTTKVPSSKGTGVVPVTPGGTQKKRPSFDDAVTEEEIAAAQQG